MRSIGGTKLSPGWVTDRTNAMIACFVAPSRQFPSGSVMVRPLRSRGRDAQPAARAGHRMEDRQSRFIIPMASFSQSRYASPLTSTTTRSIVPPVNPQGREPG